MPILLLCAGEESDRVEYLTINDGLSDNFVTHIQQDRYGYMWFGTMEGLNRFDGQAFVSFRNIPFDSTSLSDDYIRSFDEDENGNLYIVTNTGGLNYYDRKKESFRRISLRAESGREFESLSIISCSDDGIVWIGTQEGKILRFNVSVDSVDWSLTIGQDYESSSQNSINDIFEDASNNLWIASGLGGLDRIRLPEGGLDHILPADTLAESFRRNGCLKIIEDSSHKLWISRVSGLDSYDPISAKHEHFGFKDAKGEMLKASGLILNLDGQILLSSYYDLLEFNISTSTHKNITSILPQYFTSALYMDQTGIIWAGTMGYGIIKIDPRKSQFNTSPGNLLAKAFAKEMALLDGYEGVDLNVRDRDFMSVIRDRNGDVWIATAFWGLYKLNHLTQRVRRFTMGELDLRQRYQVIYQVFEDRQGEIWVSTVGGISKLDQQSGLFEYHRFYPGERIQKFAENKASYIDISDIHQDESGVFWLGTPEMGLIRFDPKIEAVSFIPVTPLQSTDANSSPILSILADPDSLSNILWLGTEGSGLVQFDRETLRSRFITQKEGLPNNTVNCVLPGTKNHLWMSTNMGLSRYSISNAQFLDFDVRDGLQSNGYNRREAYISPHGELYFGGTYGYNHFYAADIIDNPTRTPLVLTGIDLLDEPISYESPESLMNAPLTLLKDLTLDHEQGMMITFYYTALSYSNPHRDRFAYKLDGFDSRWIENGTKKSTVYTNLPPGKYQFRVRHLDDVYASDSQELSLGLIILPPYWATWWFRGILVVLSFSLLGLFIRQKFNRLQTKRLRQQLFSQQLIAYQEDERKRISGELHDGVGQNLLVIKNMLQLGLNNLAVSDQNSETFQSASNIVSETIQEVRNISHNLSPQHLEQLGLTSTLESVIENVARACEIHFKVDIDDIDDLLPPESEILVYRILQESLNNIIKHSQAKNAEVSINKEADLISIRVSDNGVGYAPSITVSSRGIGVSGMQERAQLLHGEISIEPGKDSGTVVQLFIKLDK